MDFEQFAKKLTGDLKESRPDLNFEVRDVNKLQGESYTGIAVTPEGSNIGATVNVAPLYAGFTAGKLEYDEILSKMLEMSDRAIKEMPQYDVNVLTDYSRMKEDLIVQVIPIKGNEEMLAGIPHTTIEDMAVVARFQLSENENGQSTILATNEMLKTYGITAEQLMADAMANAPDRNPARVRNMSEVLAEMTGGMMDMPPSPMWVASVESQVMGAGVLAYPGFMDQAAAQLGGDFFVLPSSVHEVLLIPDDGTSSAQVLSDMVRSINETEVEPADRLSDVAYHYDAQAQLFETAFAFEARAGAMEMPTLSDSMAPVQETHTEVLNVLMVEPGERPYEMQVGSQLEELQAAVKGDIEVIYPFEDEAVGLIMNEEGKLNGMELNRALRDKDGEVYDIIAGPFMVVGLTEDSFCSLTPEQTEKFKDMYRQPEAFVKMGKSIMAFPIPEEVTDHKAEKAAVRADKAVTPRKKTEPEH